VAGAAGTEPPDVTELWDWTLGPGESHSSEAHTAGTRELLFILDGQLELRVDQHAEVLATDQPGDVAVSSSWTSKATTASVALRATVVPAAHITPQSWTTAAGCQPWGVPAAATFRLTPGRGQQ
jgi:hypothetical protein